MAIDTHTSPVSSRIRPFSLMAFTDLRERTKILSASTHPQEKRGVGAVNVQMRIYEKREQMNDYI